MADATVATANTNPTPGSVVDVSIDKIVCSIQIEKNLYDDTLPIIPTEAKVKGGKVLYRLKLTAQVIQHSDGKGVNNQSLKIVSNRQEDKIVASGKTDSEGVMHLTIETYEAGDVELSSGTSGITLPVFKVTLKDAWYESLFLITGYNVCNEVDFSGELVEASGLNEKHKEDFLFSARGVPMQGTGMDTEGRYIALGHLGGGWHTNARGAPDHVGSTRDTSFQYVNAVLGRFGPVTENHSIAVDPHIIPPRAKVDIDGVGKRSADDKGSKIQLFHIDNFLGSGEAVVNAWKKGGINGTRRKVKFLGA